MRLSDIDYQLPERLIAQVPVEPRDSARLLVDQGPSAPRDAVMRDLPQYLRDGDVLVVNDTKVVPARLHLSRASGGAVEVLLLEPLDDSHGTWEALLRPGRKMKPGEVLYGADGAEVVVVQGRGVKGDTFRVEFVHPDPDALIDRLGEMPLPPYITQRLGDKSRYQTVYAREAKSAAAPTAGLHFTPELLKQIREMGIPTMSVELVVGLDTFAPVTTDDPRDHVIHTESYHVPTETLAAVEAARRVVAVGTTATRALESVGATGKTSGRTDLFITPGFSYQYVDVMLTNFHMPRTTLLLMISAFVGERWRQLYEHAVRSEYRFLSFGDAMLLDRH
ncbi:MAG: tRNA preQ1(34) S-adenosylmethionine ribosyltransferase-isomerase QueA, partial [Actinomycetota bacterium]